MTVTNKSFLFYISKLLFVTVILYFCIHFHLAPVEGLFFKPKYRANILCICFNFIAVLFLFLSSPWGSVYRFCTVSCDRLDFEAKMACSHDATGPCRRGLVVSSHDATSPCDLLLGLVPLCVPTFIHFFFCLVQILLNLVL